MDAAQTLAWRDLPIRFAIHIAVGVAMFLIIGIAALALHLFVGWLEFKALPTAMVLSARVLEYSLYFIDVLLFTLYTLRTAWSHGKLMLFATVE